MIERFLRQSGDFSSKATDQDSSTGSTGNKVSTAGSEESWIAHLVALNEAPEPPDPLVVEKTVETTFARTFDWTIEKSVDPETLHVFAGGSGSADYTLTLTKGEPVDVYEVSGTITITNPNDTISAVITDVTDVISGSINGNPDCGVNFPHTLAGDGQLSCTYSASLTSGDATSNTATVETTGAVEGGSVTENVVFPSTPTTTVNDSITVSDEQTVITPGLDGDVTGSRPSSQVVSASTELEYEIDFACRDGLEYTAGTVDYTVDNTATMTGTDLTDPDDEAQVTVNCYAPVVAKDATTSFTRSWGWTIDKWIVDNVEDSQTLGELFEALDLTLAAGSPFLVEYRVDLDATPEDSDWAVEGTITVTNPHPTESMTVSLSDSLGDSIAVDLTCSGSLTISADDEETCDYSADLPDGEDRTNTATATLNGIEFEGTADFTFGDDPTEEIDECVVVTDNLVLDLEEEECAADLEEEVVEIEYSHELLYQCTDEVTPVVNTASFETKVDDDNTNQTGSDSATVTVTLENCDTETAGCTLSQGYWKTHSERGPAPYDDNWENVQPSAEGTTFFSNGTYYQALWTPPGGNAYYVLAKQYIAAELNGLNGASIPQEVQDAFDEATGLFETNTPNSIGGLRGNNALRQQFLTLAGILGEYNSGTNGDWPPHCDVVFSSIAP